MVTLQNTFQHLRGISVKGERTLWEKGILNWRAYPVQLSLLQEEDRLAPSRRAFASQDIGFFMQGLPPAEYFRIALSFPDRVLFLDIETTGLSPYYHQVTLIGWSLDAHYGYVLKDEPLTPFLDALAQAKILVTFNGTLFDCKFLRTHFPQLPLPSCHIDLRFFAKRVGLSGGQKKIEALLGVRRAHSVHDLQGDSAPLLWDTYLSGDKNAAKTLITYNHADILGMYHILDACIDRICVQENIPPSLHPGPVFTRNLPALEKIVVPSPRSAKKLTYADLATFFDLDQVTVAGIDLVASDKKASGFCLLHGSHCQTKRCTTDEEMIATILDAHVNLVSIDSPLCLPKGRTSYFDDDPMRHCGITRYCERELKRRGISSYPCLIQSMQKLTERGIELSKKLRALGIATIESYPGAAQDILGIPRKQGGLERLARGLRDFGIEGDYASMSHDELDAVTSALVGYFFWVGKFEALGTEAEAPMIIPDLQVDNSLWLTRNVQVADDLTDTAALHLTVPLPDRTLLAQSTNPSVIIHGTVKPQDFATLVEVFGPGLRRRPCP